MIIAHFGLIIDRSEDAEEIRRYLRVAFLNFAKRFFDLR